MLLANGRVEEAVAACLEAIACLSELPEWMGSQLGPALAGQLEEAYLTDPERAEAEFTRLTGERFPDELKWWWWGA